MKELSEYTAEVLRRADKKKAAIRRRNKAILASSLPCLLVICLAAVLLPKFLKSPTNGREEAEAYASPSPMPAEESVAETKQPTDDLSLDGISESIDAGSCVRSVITFPGDEAVCSEDKDGSQKLAALVSAALKDCEDHSEGGYYNGAEGHESSVTCLIELTFADGSTRSFAVENGALREQDSETSHRLTHELYLEIISALQSNDD